MRKFAAAAIAAAMTLALAGPAAAGKPGWAGPDNGLTIVETAVTASGTPFEFDDNTADFDILVAAVVATGATAVLDGETDHTVFAPTDQAFLDVVSAIAGAPVTDEQVAFDALVATLGADGVLAVLTYHITDGWRPSPSVVNPKRVTMIDGNTISARGGEIVANNSTANFVATDLKTTDGGIHVIDAVLLP